MTDVQFDRATRRVLGYGHFPAHDPDDPDVGVATVADAAPLGEAGDKFLAADGTVLVVPPPPPTPEEVAAALAAQQRYDAATATLKAFRKQTPGSATNAQRDTALHAVVDVLRVQHQQLRDAGAG